MREFPDVIRLSSRHSLRTIKVVGADRTWYLYAGTELVSEFEDAASSNYSSGTTPGAGGDSGALFLYQHGDHLTTRLTTDQQGNNSNEQGHYPYGESWYATGTADPSVERKFTSYLKDAEVSTGRLNYAVARQHSSRVARFLTVDPEHGNLLNPQRLNRYSYVANNPINRIDPKGRDYCSFLATYVRPDPSERGEPADGGPRWEGGEEIEEAMPIDAQASEQNCIAAGGKWIKSSCSGGNCESHQGGPGAAGGGPGFGMVGVGGWMGGVIAFHNGVQTMAGYGNSGNLPGLGNNPPNPLIGSYGSFSGFNTLGVPGNFLGSWMFDRSPLGPPGDLKPEYQNGVFVGYNSQDLRLMLNWWNQLPPSHTPILGRTVLPGATFECQLVQQSGGGCSYNCSSVRGSPFGTAAISTSIGQLSTACPGAGGITSCPSSIQARETVAGALQVTACGL